MIDDQGEQLGIMLPFEALKIARERGLDLVEVSPNAVPPVCRIQDYGKFLYEKDKSERAARKKQKVIVVKEVKFSVTVDEHDYQTKKNQAVRFLNEGDKVKASLRFKGRQMAHRELGYAIINRLIQDMGETGIVEFMPRMEGTTLHAILAPGKKSESQRAPKPRRRNAEAARGAAGAGERAGHGAVLSEAAAWHLPRGRIARADSAHGDGRRPGSDPQPDRRIGPRTATRIQRRPARAGAGLCVYAGHAVDRGRNLFRIRGRRTGYWPRAADGAGARRSMAAIIIMRPVMPRGLIRRRMRRRFARSSCIRNGRGAGWARGCSKRASGRRGMRAFAAAKWARL